ncbi:hypothetical protein TNCV_126621 [Trichonephila clavipes]|nr:hypothetical protein TNCV_126621 [Trichonephila clavipes]
MTAIMICCDPTPDDDSADTVRSKAYVLKMVHFVHKFLTATIAASTFEQLCLYVASNDLLLGMTTQIYAFRQRGHIRSHSVVYKVFVNVGMSSLLFSLRNHKGEKKKKQQIVYL